MSDSYEPSRRDVENLFPFLYELSPPGSPLDENADPRWFSPRIDPDGRYTEAYHREHGRWPEGSRQLFEQRKRDERERYGPYDPTTHGPLDGGALRLVLFPQRFSAKLRLGSYVIDHLSVNVQEVINDEFDGMVLNFQARVLRENVPAERVKDTREVPVATTMVRPATWWDFFKATYATRWGMRWWVRRRPARTVEVPDVERYRVTAAFDLEKYRLYPRANIRVRERLGDPVMMLVPMSPVFAWKGPDVP